MRWRKPCTANRGRTVWGRDGGGNLASYSTPSSGRIPRIERCSSGQGQDQPGTYGLGG